MNFWCSRILVSCIVALWRKGCNHKKWSLVLSMLLVLLPLATVVAVCTATFKNAKADVDTVSKDPLRTSWYSDQNNLTPELVSGGTFGQLFTANIDGQVYAQPLVSKGVLLVATETNNIYGLDPATGSQKWTRKLGNPFNPADVTCSDLAPWVGITGTPAIDPNTNIAYFLSKTYVGGASGPAAWYMHAVDVATGTEQSGFPVQIQGTASNDVSHTFNATKQMQRPGLLLMNGVVYAGFAGHCDRKTFEGWVAGVATSGQLKTLWTTEAGVSEPDALGPGGGIWMSGGGLVSDGQGQIIFSTGNGEVPAANTPGKTPPGQLAQTVTRLMVQPDGSLKATDFFAPYDADVLNNNDSDLGSGAPVELPSPYFGTSSYPHIILEAGKQGYLYMLNADNLGGRGMGPSNSDAVINRLGPNGGLWSKPGVWPGDGGYIYTTTAQGGGGSGRLKAYHYGLDGAGKPTLSLVGSTTDTFGFGSTSPVITSSGTMTGSALVWAIWSADGTGVGAQLRAYDPIPVNGIVKLRYSASIGTSSKFNAPSIDNNHVYVGTRDGHVLGFGSPVNSPFTGSGLDLGTVIVGKNVKGTLNLTANSNLTVSAIGSNNTVFSPGGSTPVLPATLTSGQTIQIPITFTPTAPGLVAATITITSSAGKSSYAVSGTGEAAAGQISVAPSPISFGGVAAGGAPVTVTTTFTNVGASSITVTGQTLPNVPFSVSGMPEINSTIVPNASVTVTLTYAPIAVGSFSDTLALTTTGGVASVPLTGTAGSPGALQISSLNINVGNVAAGGNGVATFTLKNTGGSAITITRSKYPIAGVGFSPYSTLPEGTVITPGTVLTETVLFAPSTLGNATDSWSINSDDGTGVKTVTFTGTGIARVADSIQPTLYIGDATLVQPTSGTTVANVPVMLSSASTSSITVKYATKDGTATVANSDYVANSGIVTFDPGETSKIIPVTVNAHTKRGPQLTFSVNLSATTNAVLSNNSARVLLVQSQGRYNIYVGDVVVNASSSGIVMANFPVSLSAAPVTGETVTVLVSTADGTATAGKDYVALTATMLTFNPGEIQKPVAVQVNKAIAVSANKTFVLNLTTASANATIADTQSTATIVNGGTAPAPAVYVSDLFLLQPTTGTTAANFTVALGAVSSSAVTVSYATHDSTATVSGGYYLQTSGSITFSPGETSKTISVPVNSNGAYGPDVYFYLNLTGVTNAVLGDNVARATLINQLGLYILSVADTSVIQNAGSQSMAQVAISLNASVANGQTVTVRVNTTDGSAISGTSGDYIAVPLTTITFNPGQQTVLVPVLVNANSGIASPKTFTFSLTRSGSNTQTVDTTATITIINHG